MIPGAEHRFKSFFYRWARMDSAVRFLTRELLGEEKGVSPYIENAE